MSVPERMRTCVSASAEVRLKRGSTWMSRAPRSRAMSAKRKAMGWFSAMFEPMTTMQSLCWMSCSKVVAPPRPSRAPRPGTVELCQMRAWFSIQTIPRPPNSFLIR